MYRHLYRSGNAADENILEIRQTCSEREEDTARREFRSVCCSAPACFEAFPNVIYNVLAYPQLPEF